MDAQTGKGHNLQPMKHQIEKSQECYEILMQRGIVYLAGLPRSGKTYTAILTVEKITKQLNVIVFTKKNAISGWDKFIYNNDLLHHTYTVINYEQANKQKTKFDIAIIDESHNVGSIPKPNTRVKELREICRDIPIILLSGTPIVESPAKIYHQCFISNYSPFTHKNFYTFHKEFGVPYSKNIAGRNIQFYDKTKPELMDVINSFTVKMTQEDAGISADMQAVDKIHYIELKQETKDIYNYVQKNRIITIQDRQLVCDSVMKLRVSLHMIESGICKIGDEDIFIGNTEKIDYIKQSFGDTEQVGIMAHYRAERELLKKHFKHAQIYSSNAHSEGVDLSHLKHFIIISSDYSGAKHIQRRERIINVNGINTTTVNFLLVKRAISDQIYKMVSQKLDFNNSCFARNAL